MKNNKNNKIENSVFINYIYFLEIEGSNIPDKTITIGLFTKDTLQERESIYK